MTGAGSGLGLACVRALLEQDPPWHVVLAVRDPPRARRALADVGGAATELAGTPRCTVCECDLASLASVRAFAARCRAADWPPLRALICNAGVQMTSDAHRSADGFELTFAVNHLGHFALVQALHDRLAPPARIVVVTSDTHDPKRRTGMPAPCYTSAAALAHPPGDAGAAAPTARPSPAVRPSPAARPSPAVRPRSAARSAARLGRRCYTTSKLCNLLFAYELDRRLEHGARGISVNAFNPGLMPGSGLARDYGAPQRLAWRFLLPALRVLPQVRGTQQCGRHLAALVADSAYEGVSGRYFDGLKPIRSSEDSYDREKARDLWETSERITA